MEADEDELVAEIVAVLDELVEEGHLEIASRRGLPALASRLRLDFARDIDLADWLIDRVDVSEVYLDGDELRERFGAALARAEGREPPRAHHPALAAAIVEAPDDVARWAVYADWLQEQGDPRGELIALQLERQSRPDDARLAQREASLYGRFRQRFFGDLPVDDTAQDRAHVTWRLGFFDQARVAHRDDLETLLSLESARFLRTLTLREVLDPGEAFKVSRPLPETLVSLDLKQETPHLEPAGHADLERATRGLGRLEELAVHADGLLVSTLEMPKLRRLVLHTERLRIESAGAFASLECLERLEVRAAAIEAGAEALLALFARPPAGLTHLAITRLESQEAAESLIEALLASPLAGTLRSVDLRGNPLSQSVHARIEARWPKASLGGLSNDDDPDAEDEDIYAGQDEGEDDDEEEEEEEEEDEDDDDEDDETYDPITE